LAILGVLKYRDGGGTQGKMYVSVFMCIYVVYAFHFHYCFCIFFSFFEDLCNG
jgi:hypothetical protein